MFLGDAFASQAVPKNVLCTLKAHRRPVRFDAAPDSSPFYTGLERLQVTLWRTGHRDAHEIAFPSSLE